MIPKAFSQSFAAFKILFRFPTRANNERVYVMRLKKERVPVGIGIIVGPLYYINKQRKGV